MTETIHSSCRLYYESKKAPLQLPAGRAGDRPVCNRSLPQGGAIPARAWIERGYNVQHWAEMPRGAHFAAAEEPELLARDVAGFFHTLPPA